MEILTFKDFINEDLNYTMSEELGTIELSKNRWFYYDDEDEILYGSDTSETKGEFSINPESCEIYVRGKQVQYDINNPICLIEYKLDSGEIKVYTDKMIEYIQSLGYKGDSNIENPQNQKKIQKIFDDLDEEYRFLLIYGNKLSSTTFVIIEEN